MERVISHQIFDFLMAYYHHRHRHHRNTFKRLCVTVGY